MTSSTPRPDGPAKVPASGAWSRSQHVAATGAPEARFVLVDLARPAVPPRVLTDSAAALWDALETPGTTDEVLDRIAAQYGHAADDLRSDVETFLAALLDEGLVVRTPSEEAR